MTWDHFHATRWWFSLSLIYLRDRHLKGYDYFRDISVLNSVKYRVFNKLRRNNNSFVTRSHVKKLNKVTNFPCLRGHSRVEQLRISRRGAKVCQHWIYFQRSETGGEVQLWLIILLRVYAVVTYSGQNPVLFSLDNQGPRAPSKHARTEPQSTHFRPSTGPCVCQYCVIEIALVFFFISVVKLTSL